MEFRNVIRKSTMCVVMLAVFSAPRFVSAQDGDHMSKNDVKTLVTNAKTAEDHERLAKHFDAEANQLDAEASEHRELAAVYKANPSGDESKHPMSGKTAGHCDYFANDAHKAAMQDRALAAAHRAMAKDASK